MPLSAEPVSLSVRLGRIVIISAPQEHAPSKLDWNKWVVNTALCFERFHRPAPRRIFLLDKVDVHGETDSTTGIEYARQNIQTADVLALLSSWAENTLVLSYGSWHFTLSSWVESMRQVTHARHMHVLGEHLQRQLDLWKDLEATHHDESLFVLSDTGTRFLNASEHCQGWLRRVIRSRLVQEPKQGAWSAAVVQVLAPLEANGQHLKVQRMASLSPTEWCGDPKWQENFSELLSNMGHACSEVWVSLPSAGLTIDVFERLRSNVIGENSKLIAPSMVLGWHPVRDFLLFLNSKVRSRLFVFMDAHERIQLIFATTEDEAIV